MVNDKKREGINLCDCKSRKLYVLFILKKNTFTCLLLFFSFYAAYSQNDSIPDPAKENKQAKMYSFRPVVDIPVITVGCAWSAFAFPKIYSKEPSTEEEILNLDKSKIPSFDRWAAGKSNEDADNNSDYFMYGSIPVPFALLLDKKIRHDAGRGIRRISKI